MGVDKLLTKRCVQTAVYWANPVNDGYGKYTFDDPIEIRCRWEEKDQVLTKLTGSEERFISRAVVFVLQDMQVNELLYLGTLNDLDSGEEVDPSTITDIAIIKRFEKTPMLGSTDTFLRMAFLTPWLT